MGFFSKLFKGPEIDLEQSAANAARMRGLFDAVVPEGGKYRLIFGYTEDGSRFNYGFAHGSKTKIGNLIVGWDEAGEPTFYRRSEIQTASRNKYSSQVNPSRAKTSCPDGAALFYPGTAEKSPCKPIVKPL